MYPASLEVMIIYPCKLTHRYRSCNLTKTSAKTTTTTDIENDDDDDADWLMRIYDG